MYNQRENIRAGIPVADKKERDAVFEFCTPLSFGLMVKVTFVKNVQVGAGMEVCLSAADDGQEIKTEVMNVEKDYTVSTEPVNFLAGETANIVLSYTDELLHFSLRGAGLVFERWRKGFQFG